MIVKSFEPESFTKVTEGLSFGSTLPEEGTGRPPFNALWVRVGEGEETPVHRHHDLEFFIIVQGRGLATCGEKEVEVGPGDVLYFPPLTFHTIRNVGGDEDLLLLDLYWADMSSVDARNAAERLLGDDRKTGRRVLVFGAPPTANGDLHLGHVSGPYLSADIHTRFRRMKGDDAHLLLGTDTSQCWVAEKAQRTGLSPLETADAFSAKIRDTLERARISFSRFYAPAHTPSHRRFVSDMVAKLYADGFLVAKDAPALVCPSCDRYLFEAFVAGTCPHCGSGCCGNGCEECCQPNDCVDLVDPSCRLCGTRPVEEKVRRLYFPLEKVRPRLEAYLDSADLRPQHRALCKKALASPLPELVASHITDWGIPVPVEGFEGQCINSWLEGGAGYLTAADQFAGELWGLEGWETCWKADEAEVVQFFGFDNSWVHALFFPATFLAFDADVRPPAALIANHFYRLEDEKFSTSRGHAVWARDLIEETSADVVRFYLCYTSPETRRTNFARREFAECVRRELVEGWQGWLRDLSRRLDHCFDCEVPEAGVWTDLHIRYYADLRALVAQLETAYGAATFSPQLAARTACELVRRARSFGEAQAAWATLPETRDRLRTGLALELAAARALALGIAPMMPDFAGRLWEALGYTSEIADQAWDPKALFIPYGRRLFGLEAEYFPEPPAAEEEERQPLAAVAGE